MRPSLFAYESLQEQGIYARQFVEDLTDRHEGYTHTISAVGGFTEASFSLKGPRSYLEDWFENGLMRRVIFYNTESVPVWEGFVFALTYSFGTIQKSKSMETVCNRVYFRFTPLNVSTVPPTPGLVTTLVYNDVTSQAKYGVKAQVVNGGEVTHEEAYTWAQAVLREGGQPKMGESINTGSTGAPQVTVTCKGYWEVLAWLPYLNSMAGQIQSSQAVQEVLNAFNAVNFGWLSASADWLNYNYRRERRSADEYKTCQEVIRGIIERGGLSGERWVGGVYQDRRFVYKPAEDFKAIYSEFLYYTRRLDDPSHKIHDATGAEVKPWDAEPDRILVTLDM
jgi:hypothetical protein